jgi:hypothetical protein
LGGGARGPRVPIINTENVDSGPPWEAVPEVRGRPLSTLKMSRVGP